MAKISYQLMHLFFEKLKAEDSAFNKTAYSNNQIDPQIATERVLGEVSGFLLENFSDDKNKEKIYRNLFKDSGKITIWNEVFSKDKHSIESDELKKYIVTDKSYIETLYNHYLDYKNYNGNTRSKTCYTIAFYFKFLDIKELENDIEKACPNLKKLFSEDLYSGLFDNLPHTPNGETKTETTVKKGNPFNFNRSSIIFWKLVAILLFLTFIVLITMRLIPSTQENANVEHDFEQEPHQTAKALSRTEQEQVQEALAKLNLSLLGNSVTVEEHFETAKNSKESWYFCTYVYWLDTYGEFLELIGNQLIAGERKVKILFPDNEENREMVKSYVAMHKEKNPDIEKYLKTLPAQFPEFMGDLINTFTIYDPLTENEQTLLVEPDMLEIESKTETSFIPFDIRLSKKKSSKYAETFIKIWNRTAKEQGKPEEWIISQ